MAGRVDEPKARWLAAVIRSVPLWHRPRVGIEPRISRSSDLGIPCRIALRTQDPHRRRRRERVSLGAGGGRGLDTSWSRLRRATAAWAESDWFIPILVALLALLIGALLLLIQWMEPGVMPFTGTHWT